jgi:hypothetical protein
MSSYLAGPAPAPAEKPWYKSLTVWLNLALLVAAYLIEGLTSGDLVLPGVVIDGGTLAKISNVVNIVLRVGYTSQGLYLWRKQR